MAYRNFCEMPRYPKYEPAENEPATVKNLPSTLATAIYENAVASGALGSRGYNRIEQHYSHKKQAIACIEDFFSKSMPTDLVSAIEAVMVEKPEFADATIIRQVWERLGGDKQSSFSLTQAEKRRIKTDRVARVVLEFGVNAISAWLLIKLLSQLIKSEAAGIIELNIEGVEAA